MSATDIPATSTVEEIPTLESVEPTSMLPSMDSRAGKSQKRYAKGMQKLGLVPEGTVTRVTVKGKQMSFDLQNAEAYRFPGTTTFVVFGELRVDESAMNEQAAAARTVTATAPAEKDAKKPEGKEGKKNDAKKGETPATTAIDDEDVDIGDLDEKTVAVVMQQANVSKAQAVKALKSNKSDIVNAIMELTM